MAESIVEELARKRLGRTIKGKWNLDRLIGVGGMAAVYAATHRNGSRVAIKMLHATVSASESLRARFVREGYLANRVGHPGVVRVLDDDIDDEGGCAFLVMDLVEGRTLADRAIDRLLNAGELLDVAGQVLSVLVAAHAKGIVHRDLKPENLLVDDTGQVRVLDFGIAGLIEDATNPSYTKTGTAFGTPGFMSPEQAMGRVRQVTARTDLYSLGATLFALATGDFVHPAQTPQELVILVATRPPRSLATLAPHLPPEVIGLVDRAVQLNPEARWSSAQAMLDEVNRLKLRLGLRNVRTMPLPPSEMNRTEDDRARLRFAPTEAEPEAERPRDAIMPAPSMSDEPVIPLVAPMLPTLFDADATPTPEVPARDTNALHLTSVSSALRPNATSASARWLWAVSGLLGFLLLLLRSYAFATGGSAAAPTSSASALHSDAPDGGVTDPVGSANAPSASASTTTTPSVLRPPSASAAPKPNAVVRSRPNQAPRSDESVKPKPKSSIDVGY